MSLNARQLHGIDRALGVGVTVTFQGKEWTFSPMTFRMYAELVATRKGKAASAYLNGVHGQRMLAGDRGADISRIMMRPMSVPEDTDLSDPENLLLACTISLRKSHPEIADEQVDQLLDDEATREQIADLMNVLNAGEVTSGGGEADPSEGNPTGT